MKFEFDPAKSQSNKAEQGIDFEEALALWNDVERLEIPVACKDEECFALIGRMGPHCRTAIFTWRGDAVRRGKRR